MPISPRSDQIPPLATSTAPLLMETFHFLWISAEATLEFVALQLSYLLPRVPPSPEPPYLPDVRTLPAFVILNVACLLKTQRWWQNIWRACFTTRSKEGAPVERSQNLEVGTWRMLLLTLRAGRSEAGGVEVRLLQRSLKTINCPLVPCHACHACLACHACRACPQ